MTRLRLLVFTCSSKGRLSQKVHQAFERANADQGFESVQLVQLQHPDTAAAALQEMAAFLQAPGCKGFVYCSNQEECLDPFTPDGLFAHTHHLSCLYLFLDDVPVNLNDTRSNWVTLTASSKSDFVHPGMFTVWGLLPALTSCLTPRAVYEFCTYSLEGQTCTLRASYGHLVDLPMFE
mgnify:CR=1 FL=1